MGKCSDCLKEVEMLYSIDRNGKTVGDTLCKECANKELEKQGRPKIK